MLIFIWDRVEGKDSGIQVPINPIETAYQSDWTTLGSGQWAECDRGPVHSAGVRTLDRI